MNRRFQKLAAVILALVMALGCAAASAQTVQASIAIDSDAAAQLVPALSGEAENTKTILELISALGYRVTTAEDGAQVDLELNGKDLLSLGIVSGGSETVLVSTLFPSYALKLDAAALEQLTANTPFGGFTSMFGGTADGSESGTAAAFTLPESAQEYLSTFMESVMGSVTTGEAETGEFEVDGVKFDTMVPVTVDSQATAEAGRTLADRLLNDESVVASVQSWAEKFGASEFSADSLRDGLNEFFGHFPDAVTAESYSAGDGSGAFCVTGRAARDGEEEPISSYTILFRDGTNGTITFRMTEPAMDVKLEIAENSFRVEMTMDGSTKALEASWKTGETTTEVRAALYMDSDKPVISVEVTVAEGGERTLVTDTEGKTLLSMAELSNSESTAVKGLLVEISAGLFKLLPSLMQEVPGISTLVTNYITQLMSSGKTGTAAENAGEPEEVTPEAAEKKTQTLRLGTSVYTIEVDASYAEGELTAEDLADDMVAYMKSPDILMDFDVYQFSKEGWPDTLEGIMLQEKEKYNASGWGTQQVNGIDMGWFDAEEEYEGVTYETYTYILDSGDDYVEITFWLDGENAAQDAEKIMESIGFITRDGE